MPALTRDEAETRARLLTVHDYAIELDFTHAADAGTDTFASTTTVRFTARQHGDTFIELRPAALHHATLDGTRLDPATLSDGRLPLTGLTPGEHRLRVTAGMPYSRTGEGIHRFTDPADGASYLYSMCCLGDAPLVYAAFDQPDLKAVFDVTVTAPPSWTVLGNGTATPAGEQPGRWRCATTPPISTYLMAVAAGPYHSVRTRHNGLTFGIHARRSLAEHLDKDADEILALTRRCFDRYQQIFREPYPFDSYDQAFVPEFNYGAMENPGLVTFSDTYVYRSAVTDSQRELRGVTIAHEMAHMWFGNLVTLRWWDDIWLNESFAEYMGYQVLTDATAHQPWTEFAATRKPWGCEADQRPSTHPVAPDPAGIPDTASALSNFDGISYAKGAAALRQLVAWLGNDTFLAGINDHFARHRFANATLHDFIDAMARASGRDVHAWARAWLRTTGPDTLTPALHDDPAGWRLALSHTGKPTTPRPHRLRIGAYDTTPGDPTHVTPRAHHDLELDAEEGTTHRTYPGPRPSLLVVNDGDLTYAKTRLDPASWATASRALSSLPDPLTRAVVWNAARDMVRDGELPPLAYLAAARRTLPTEPVTALTEAVLAFARTQIADHYLPGDQRTAALATLTDLAHDLLASPEPTRRLVAARTLIDAATTPGDIRAWWQAGAVPGGPPLDHELRWRLLYRLAVLGAATPAEIDAEARHDPTATGEESAARCRAALPDPAAKRAAWDAMFDEADRLSNYLFTATAQGFWQPEQRDLLASYLPRYFPDAAALAARRGHALARAAARHAFPRGFTDPRTLRLGEHHLATATLHPTLRRGLADQLDDLRRALRLAGNAT